MRDCIPTDVPNAHNAHALWRMLRRHFLRSFNTLGYHFSELLGILTEHFLRT
jgi:aspartyl/asparaginyl beta-hydroxylase (cupin superfamily)